MALTCKHKYIKRRSYRRLGKYYPESCIRSTSVYAEKYNQFQQKERKRMTLRMRGISRSTRGNTQRCTKGILRKSYIRISKNGTRQLIKAKCIKQRGKGSTVKIGPIRKGLLTQFGYVHVDQLYKKHRYRILKKAIKYYGSLSVWKKLNVLSVFTKYNNPKLHHIYQNDKQWIQSTFGIKAQFM